MGEGEGEGGDRLDTDWHQTSTYDLHHESAWELADNAAADVCKEYYV